MNWLAKADRHEAFDDIPEPLHAFFFVFSLAFFGIQIHK
jgi:hypothetical protein